MTYSINSFSNSHEEEIRNLAKSGHHSGYTGGRVDRLKSITIHFKNNIRIHFWDHYHLWMDYEKRYLPIGLNLSKYMI